MLLTKHPAPQPLRTLADNTLQVQGPKGSGRVGIHLIKRPDQHEHEYKYFFIDIKGHQRIYLENADTARPKDGEQKGFKLFGVKWGS